MFRSTSTAANRMEPRMPEIEFRGVFKRYPNAKDTVTVFHDLSLASSSPELLVLLGDNGCGKSTLLQLAAGTESPDQGSVIRKTAGPVGWMPQDYSTSLLPWATARRNILLPLELCGSHRNDAANRLESIASELGFGELRLDVYPHQLSGGQRQRVALLRALLVGAPLVLLDEPFASLDTPTLDTLLPRLRMHLRSVGATAIVVLHDIEEALLLADRIVVLGGVPSRITYDVRLSSTESREEQWLFTPDLIDIRKQVFAARRVLQRIDKSDNP